VLRELQAQGWSKRDIAERLGVEAPTVSRWENGTRQPELALLPRIDQLLGRPRGEVLRRAGFVEEVADVRSAIAADPLLTDKSKSALSLLYDVLTAQDAGVRSPVGTVQAAD
jgi:transcriptional regulator with XRE-family HTH domain